MLSEHNNTVRKRVESLMDDMITEATSRQQALIDSIRSLQPTVIIAISFSRYFKWTGVNTDMAFLLQWIQVENLCYINSLHTGEFFIDFNSSSMSSSGQMTLDWVDSSASSVCLSSAITNDAKFSCWTYKTTNLHNDIPLYCSNPHDVAPLQQQAADHSVFY